MLCGLALETVADVSNVDLVHEGVLRRVAAEVANDPALTAWLRAAVPPAKPGTATWAALRDGGARLVVPDPTVPRSPGGTGERLNLTWWVAVALEHTNGTPAAIWGLGGPRVDIRYRARRSSASSPTRHTMISRSPPSPPCCAVGWRRLDVSVLLGWPGSGCRRTSARSETRPRRHGYDPGEATTNPSRRLRMPREFT